MIKIYIHVILLYVPEKVFKSLKYSGICQGGKGKVDV